jgi:hypothetical protein
MHAFKHLFQHGAVTVSLMRQQGDSTVVFVSAQVSEHQRHSSHEREEVKWPAA